MQILRRIQEVFVNQGNPYHPACSMRRRVQATLLLSYQRYEFQGVLESLAVQLFRLTILAIVCNPILIFDAHGCPQVFNV